MSDLPDFDTLKWLAENNPAELEQLQEKLSQEIIAHSQHSEQLKSLHFQIKQRMARCNNPYHRCVTATTMMREKLCTLADTLNNPQEFQSRKASVTQIKDYQKACAEKEAHSSRS